MFAFLLTACSGPARGAAETGPREAPRAEPARAEAPNVATDVPPDVEADRPSGGPAAASLLPWLSPLAVSAGSVCWITPERTVRCWGHSEVGGLGNGSVSASRQRSVRARGLERVVGLAAPDGKVCALTEEHAVYCWGLFRPLSANPEVVSTPRRIGGLDDVVQLSGGTALQASGVVLRGFADGEATPLDLPPVARVVSLDGSHGCAIELPNRVHCWGLSLSAGSDAPPVDATPQPRPVPELDGAIALSMGGTGGEEFVCALHEDGAILCLGHVGVLQQAIGEDEVGEVRIAVPDAVGMAAGLQHLCVVRRAGSVRCVGEVATGALGGLPDSVFVAAQRAALLDDGSVSSEWTARSWGRGVSAEVVGAQNVRAISASGPATCTMGAAGHVRCWGIDGVEPANPHVGLPDFIGLGPDGSVDVEPFHFEVDIPAEPVLGSSRIEVRVREGH